MTGDIAASYGIDMTRLLEQLLVSASAGVASKQRPVFAALRDDVTAVSTPCPAG